MRAGRFCARLDRSRVVLRAFVAALHFAFCLLRFAPAAASIFFFDLKFFEKNFCAAPCVYAKNIREISTFLVCRGPVLSRIVELIRVI